MFTEPVRISTMISAGLILVFLLVSIGAGGLGPQTRYSQGMVPDAALLGASSGHLWYKALGLFYGGPGACLQEDDYPQSICSLGQGAFAISGLVAAVFPPDVTVNDAAIVKFDSLGGVAWKSLYPFNPGDNLLSLANAVTTASDGGCLAVGSTYESGETHVLGARLDSAGAYRWIKSYWLGHDDQATAVLRTRDNGFLLAATTEPPEGGSGIWLFRIDAMGDVVWSRVFRAPWVEAVRSLTELPDGRIMVAGNFVECGYKLSLTWAFVMRLSPTGGKEWVKAYWATPGANESGTAVNSLVATADGGFALAGYIALPEAEPKIWVCRLNSLGDITWQKTYYGQRAESIIVSSDGGFLVVGGSPARAIKLDSTFRFQWAKEYGPSQQAETILGAFEKNEGGYVMFARSHDALLSPGFYYTPMIVMSVDPNGFISPGCPFVRGVAGGAKWASARRMAQSFSVSSATPSTHVLAYPGQGFPSVRVWDSGCHR